MSVKSFIAFMAGTVIGGAASAFVVKTVLIKKNEEELETVRVHYAEKLDILETKLSVLENAVSPVEESKDTDISSNKKTKSKTTKKKEIVDDLDKAEEIAEQMGYTAEPVEEKPKTTSKKKKKEPDIFVIEPDDYHDRESGYDQVVLTYFEEDGKFLDEYDEDYKDGFDVTGGDDILDRIGEYEPNIVYVRNKLTGCDYCVVKERRTYREYMAEEYGE